MKRKLLLFAGGILSALVLLEALFRILPVSTATRSGYYIHPLILTYPPHHCFTAATGWDLKNVQRNCANNLGFLADRDFVRNPEAIALIGDSFVEANMLPAQDRLGAQLEAKLNGKVVYAMGGPGSSLLDYAERARYAADNLGTRTFVFVLERGDIKQALCGSGNVHGPCLDPTTLEPRTEIQPRPSTSKQVIRESALAQYVFSQIKFKFDASKLSLNMIRTSSDSKSPLAQTLPSSNSTALVNRFFGSLSTIKDARFIFLVDSERPINPRIVASENDDLKYFRSSAHKIGAAVLDPTALFEKFYSDTKKVLEIGPYDRHWNRDAVRIIAEQIHLSLYGVYRVATTVSSSAHR